MKVKFIKSAPTIKEAIEPNFTEVALLGRSNVGKSSFLNTFTNQKIAKVSSTPGKTKLINFFEIEDKGKKYVLVDLPGFGYAKVSKSMLKDWGKNLDEFLKNRYNIKLFIHLRDARHPDLDIDNNVDEYLKSFLRKDQQILTVFTKIDKLKQSELAKLKQKYPEALFVSNLKKRGIDKVKEKINEILWGNYENNQTNS
ncbi:YihA family ribosome biogenesis GTP-binding protein [Caminibacter mediatlanticus TB-2]|uniref:Probable GTP-binding protein EngB n=1 Tax=Caminibacter mediatlanticus TB-2 TaxID=391592 RepID=A0ABX5V940_9BACT|nr:ribosome biogenesis GTP-binding protein YihA/YsxC [Caminibacter mediatlanticus]QCT94763.1 YihA family ribosome biogenesis GTP-binding protein [Caminibacter mediatlanticus TB-2]